MSCPAGVVDSCSNSLSGTSSHLFLALINTFMTSKCALDTQPMFPKDYDCSINTFDFIVVGGGTAGTVVANRLTENPNWKVLLIEAGGLPDANNEIPGLSLDSRTNRFDWGYTTISPGMCLGIKNGSCYWPRAKVLGGCSAINAMLYTRGRKQDYDNWKLPGWNYASVLPYFKKSESCKSNIHDKTLHGFDGPQATSDYKFPRKIRTGIFEAAKQLGLPVTIDAPDIGYHNCLMNIENGKRCQNAKAFISKIKNRKNLYLATNTLVKKLLINTKTKSVNGVLISEGKCSSRSEYRLYATKEVILSAGAIGSPEILLKSEIGPGKSIANLPVGENLQDHLINFGIMIKFNNKSVADPETPYDNIDMLYNYFLKSQGPLATMDLINLMGFINTKKDSNLPDIELMHNYYPQNDVNNMPVILPTIGLGQNLLNYFMSINKNYSMLHIAPMLLRPKSVGRLTIRNEKINIFPNYLQKNDDVETMLRAISFVKRFIQTPAMRAFGAEIIEVPLPKSCGKFDTRSYWICLLHFYCGSIFHPIGTCKMGLGNDRSAVVSLSLRVYGVSNLRVVDASVIPTHITAHSNAPTTMIAEKVSDIIKKDYGYKQ